MVRPEKESLIAAYLARSPEVATSQEIVKELSREYGISQSKLRAKLVSGGVYVAQPRKKTDLDDQDIIALREFAWREGVTGATRDGFAVQAGEKFNVSRWIIETRMREEKIWPMNDHEIACDVEWEARKHEIWAEHEKRWPVNNLSKPEYSFQERLDGSAGWFGNPLWILNTIVVIFLVALVFTGIASIFR